MDFSKNKFNIIGEVMGDGQGDWSWVFYILKQLISFGAKPNNINIIYYNIYDGVAPGNTICDTKFKLEKLSSVLKDLECRPNFSLIYHNDLTADGPIKIK